MEALRLEEGNPGPRARAAARRGLARGPRQGLHRVDIRPASGSGPSSSSPSRPASRARGSCPRPASRPTGRTASAARSASRDPYELGAGVLPLGVRDRGRRPRPRDQPVRPAGRPGGEGQDERGARRGRARTSRRAARSTSCSAQARRGRLRRDPGVHRPGARGRARAARSPGRTRPAASSRAASGRATCTRPGQLHKGGPNTGLFIQVVDDTGDELAIPGRDFGFGRLIRAQAAGDFAALEERGRRVVAHPTGGHLDATRNGRPRPDGLGDDEAARAARARGQDVRPERRRRRRRRSARSRSSSSTPRHVWMMVPAGKITEDTFQKLLGILEPGDTIVDGGNSNFRDSQRRYKEARKREDLVRRRRRLGRHLGPRGRLLPDGRRRQGAAEAARADLRGARARGRLRARRRRPAPATSRRWSTTGSSTA